MTWTILPQRQKKPSFLHSFVHGLAEQAPDIAGAFLEHKKEKKKKQEEEEENKALEALGIPAKGIKNPKLREALLEHTYKSKESQAKNLENEKLTSTIEEQRGLPSGSLKGLASNPKIAEQVSRPAKLEKKTQASQPIDPEQLAIIQKVRKNPDYREMDELEKYQALTDSGVSRENARDEAELAGKKLERQSKTLETSYKAQEDFIKDTTNKYKAWETETKPKLMQLQKQSTNEQIVSPSSAKFLELMGIPLGVLENPSSELYQKVSQDLLKGLPETYGNKILAVEVDNFLKTIPTLLNSPDGRRMIASNMLKLGEMKEVYYNEMRRQQRESLDNNKPFPRDFQQRVFDQVKPQIDKINNQFVKLSEITSVPPGTIPFFDPNGDVVFVDKEFEQWAIDEGGERVW